MKKVIGAVAVVLGMFSVQVMAGDGPNPCQWEHDPQPAYCKVKRDKQENKVASAGREQSESYRYSGGDR